ncbi:MAG UNVERIFIED_CONTAM: hypothetical protein LVR18_16900 [Planctomycetaceae bacterium]
MNVDGTGTATSGVTINAGAASDQLRIRTRSQLTVNNAVTNTGGGGIILASEGNLVTDDLAINANVTATGGSGDISLYAGDSISLAATVTVSAAGTGNILLSGSTDYNAGTPQNGFNAPAGADGRISMTSGALIQSANGSITLQADGDILLSSVQSTGGGTITITANYDGIDAGLAADNSGAILDNLAAETANITTSGLVVLDAASGIGTSTDDINTDIGQLNASVNSIGSLYLTDANAITLTDVDTFNGSITITAGGQITATDVESLTDAEANDIILRTTAGSILVGRISAGSTGDVWLNSAAAVEESGNDAAADIVAETLEINAATGIGAADELEINAFNLGAATTAGAIVLLDTAGGLTISSVNVDGTGTATSGVAINAGAASDQLRIRTRSQLTVNNAVTNTGGGGIILASEGNLVTDDLAINANVTATGGSGNISLYAGDSISLAATVTVSVTGTGNILLSGSTDFNGGTHRNGYDAPAGFDGRITMTSGALIQSASGSITLQADGDILLSRVVSTGGATITITANYDGIDTGLAADNSGTILDNLTGDNANITTSGLAILDAGSGIGTSSDDINTNIGQLNASVNSAGSLFLVEVNAVTLTDVDTSNGSITIIAGGTITATDVASLTDADANDITLTTTSGNIAVALINAGTTAGDVTLIAAGSIIEAASDAGADILGERLTLTAVNGIGVSGDHIEITAVSLDATVTGAGSILLAETDAITLTDVDTQNGAITISAGGTITATDVASLTDADANDILLSTTAGDILVALINAGTTAGDVTLSVTGAIIETASDIQVDITADSLTLIATNGIGVAADPIETQINTLSAENSGSGNIEIVEVAGSDLTLLSVRQTNSAGTGSINIATANGQLRLAANGFGVHSAGTGNIQLTAGGAASDLSVFSNISGNGGNVTLQAGRDILLGEGNTLAGGSGPRGVAISAAGPAAVLAAGGAAAGNTVLSVRSAGGFVAGQEVQLVDGLVSERAVISSVDLTARTITLTSPLLGTYSSATQVLTRRVAATLTTDATAATAVLAVNDTALFAAGTRVDIEVAGTVQTGVVSSVDAGAGTITLTQPLTFGAATGARIFAARDQAISLIANRNLLAADGTLLTTDNLRSGSYSDLRGDRISVVVDADNNAFREDRNGDTNLTIADYIGAGGIQDGVLLLGANSRLRTDGGVASGFANRPLISETLVATNTAFFTDFADPSVAVIGAVDGQLRYSVSFSLVLPSPGEEERSRGCRLARPQRGAQRCTNRFPIPQLRRWGVVFSGASQIPFE